MCNKSAGSRLRSLLQQENQTTLVPFGVLPIHAQMAEHAGFEAFWLSGANLAWWVGGVPDVGWMTMTEVVGHAARVARSVNIPVFCDADTGYGGPVNIQRTVQEFIHAGVAGIHIEDQLEPKKAGRQPGIELVSDAAAVGRLRAAVDARNAQDPDFVIVARTDGYDAEGGSLDEAIRRGNLYLREAAVDAVLYVGLLTWAEIGRALAETEGPAMAMGGYNDSGSRPSMSELGTLGQRFQYVPFATPGLRETWRLLCEVRSTADLTPLDTYNESIQDRRGTVLDIGLGDIFARPTYADVRRIEDMYLPDDIQREYTERPT